MSLRRQVTGALAWAGLVIVIAVPAAETVSSHLLSSVKPAAAATAQIPPAAPASKAVAEVAPAKPAPAIQPAAKPVLSASAALPAQPQAAPAEQAPAVAAVAAASTPSAPAQPANAQAVSEAKAPAPADPVKDYLAANKTLPSYIKPTAPSKPDTAAVDPAALTPAAQKLSAKLDSAAPPADGIPPASGTAVASAGATTATPVPPPLPMPVTARPKPRAERTVTEADLKDWKSGTLEDYLKSHGLLSGGTDAQGGGF